MFLKKIKAHFLENANIKTEILFGKVCDIEEEPKEHILFIKTLMKELTAKAKLLKKKCGVYSDTIAINDPLSNSFIAPDIALKQLDKKSSILLGVEVWAKATSLKERRTRMEVYKNSKVKYFLEIFYFTRTFKLHQLMGQTYSVIASSASCLPIDLENLSMIERDHILNKYTLNLSNPNLSINLYDCFTKVDLKLQRVGAII